MFKSGSVVLFKGWGIPVRVHWSFPLIFLYVIWDGLQNEAPSQNILVALLFLFVVFVCVLLHEFGHALAAKMYNIETYAITILPIGGVAHLTRMPQKPVQELVVALAGPLINLLISILIAVGLTVAAGLNPFDLGSILDSHISSLSTPKNFLIAIWQTNLLLAIFNMIPAFPMDGGRVLRACLSYLLGRPQATRWATLVSSFFAVVGLIYAIHNYSWIAGLISLFILFQARSENYQVQLDSLLDFGKVEDILERPVERLTTRHSVAAAFRQLAKTKHGGVLVFDTDVDIPTGYLSVEKITRQLTKPDGPMKPLGQLNLSAIATIRPQVSLSVARHLMAETGCDALAVCDNDTFIGVIDRDRLYGYAELMRALGAA